MRGFSFLWILCLLRTLSCPCLGKSLTLFLPLLKKITAINSPYMHPSINSFRILETDKILRRSQIDKDYAKPSLSCLVRISNMSFLNA